MNITLEQLADNYSVSDLTDVDITHTSLGDGDTVTLSTSGQWVGGSPVPVGPTCFVAETSSTTFLTAGVSSQLLFDTVQLDSTTASAVTLNLSTNAIEISPNIVYTIFCSAQFKNTYYGGLLVTGDVPSYNSSTRTVRSESISRNDPLLPLLDRITHCYVKSPILLAGAGGKSHTLHTLPIDSSHIASGLTPEVHTISQFGVVVLGYHV